MAEIKSRYLVESYNNGSSWYRKYSDGWIEQGGVYSTSGNVNKTINFIIPFNNRVISIINTFKRTSSGGAQGVGAYSTGSLTSFVGTAYGILNATVCWESRGY